MDLSHAQVDDILKPKKLSCKIKKTKRENDSRLDTTALRRDLDETETVDDSAVGETT
jgi:hypothetical protein